MSSLLDTYSMMGIWSDWLYHNSVSEDIPSHSRLNELIIASESSNHELYGGLNSAAHLKYLKAQLIL